MKLFAFHICRGVGKEASIIWNGHCDTSSNPEQDFAFHIELIPLGKVWIQLFFLQLSINRRADWALQSQYGSRSRGRKTEFKPVKLCLKNDYMWLASFLKTTRQRPIWLNINVVAELVRRQHWIVVGTLGLGFGLRITFLLNQLPNVVRDVNLCYYFTHNLGVEEEMVTCLS